MKKRCFLLVCAAFCLAFAWGQKKEGKKNAVQISQTTAYDSVYTKLLARAHKLFRERQFEAARQEYRKDMQKYPNDAYIKAKITDLDIIIDYLNNPPPPPKPHEPTDEELAEQARREKIYMEKVAREREALMKARQDLLAMKKLKDIRQSNEPKEKEDPTPPQQNEITKIPEVQTDKTTVPKKAEIRKQEVTVEKALEEFQKELAKEYPAGMTEDKYMDGKVKITRRIVVENNRGNEYKKAEHPWGAKYYFKNKLPITEREWHTETDKWIK